MYTADDFNTADAPKEMVQYVIDNVEGFQPRYQYALYVMEQKRCSLEHALEELYYDIWDAIVDYWQDKPELQNKGIYIEDIFG